MEWTEAHDLILAKEVRASEPLIFKPRTVDRGKEWNAITDHLNDETSVKFQVKKKQLQEHFKVLLDKFKAKRKHQAKLSGVEGLELLEKLPLYLSNSRTKSNWTT